MLVLCLFFMVRYDPLSAPCGKIPLIQTRAYHYRGVVISKNIIFVSALVCRMSTVQGVVFSKAEFTPRSAYFLVLIGLADRFRLTGP